MISPNFRKNYIILIFLKSAKMSPAIAHNLCVFVRSVEAIVFFPTPSIVYQLVLGSKSKACHQLWKSPLAPFRVSLFGKETWNSDLRHVLCSISLWSKKPFPSTNPPMGWMNIQISIEKTLQKCLRGVFPNALVYS